jgi:hypothetical protein
MNNEKDEIVMYIVQEETGFALISSEGYYGVVYDCLEGAIVEARIAIKNGIADNFCIGD